eukprot:768499-Hanusia_phi.AAC.1
MPRVLGSDRPAAASLAISPEDSARCRAAARAVAPGLQLSLRAARPGPNRTDSGPGRARSLGAAVLEESLLPRIILRNSTRYTVDKGRAGLPN